MRSNSERMLDTSSHPVQPVDLFGRTEAELRAAIAWQERMHPIAASYGGGEGAAIKLAMKRSNLEVDRRQLAIMRGDAIDDSPRLTPAAREKLHREVIARARTWNGAPKEGK
jgi:hypothetical protein